MNRRKLTDKQKQIARFVPGRITDFGLHERGVVVRTMDRPWCCAPPRETLWLEGFGIVRDIDPKEVQWGWQ